MAKYFTLQELCASETAARKKIVNVPNAKQNENLLRLADNLDKVREAFGAPIRITSGFRSPDLNAAAGGVANSAHVQGNAADMDVGSHAENKRLFDLCVELNRKGVVCFDQLIDEHNLDWVHIGFSNNAQRGQIFKL